MLLRDMTGVMGDRIFHGEGVAKGEAAGTTTPVPTRSKAGMLLLVTLSSVPKHRTLFQIHSICSLSLIHI